jgi:hypothetical protein
MDLCWVTKCRQWRGGVVLDNTGMTVTQLVKYFSAFYGTPEVNCLTENSPSCILS